MEGALRWQEETKCEFPYFTDISKSVYKIFSLKRSVKMVWDIPCLKYYGAKVAEDITLPDFSDIKDDPHQLGGDFMIDRNGKLLFIYRSRNPSDRPTLDLILEKAKC